MWKQQFISPAITVYQRPNKYQAEINRTSINTSRSEENSTSPLLPVLEKWFMGSAQQDAADQPA
jgi:hypothetical protein